MNTSPLQTVQNELTNLLIVTDSVKELAGNRFVIELNSTCQSITTAQRKIQECTILEIIEVSGRFFYVKLKEISKVEVKPACSTTNKKYIVGFKGLKFAAKDESIFEGSKITTIGHLDFDSQILKHCIAENANLSALEFDYKPFDFKPTSVIAMNEFFEYFKCVQL